MRASHVSRLTFALACLTTLLTAAWAPVPQTGEISVIGQVINATSGGVVPEDLSVVLHVFSGMEEMQTYTTALAADNSFRFDGLVPQDGQVFVARVVYQDVSYASEFVTFEPGQETIALPVTMYETTEDPAAVQVTQMHMFVSDAGDRVQVAEYHLIGNAGDRTYVGVEDPETGLRLTLNFTLPDGAEELYFEDSGSRERFLERAGGFADTEPVLPGSTTVEVLFGYQIPYRERIRVERSFEVPVASVVILLSAQGLTLEGEGIVPGGTMDTQMGSALSYTAGPLAAGETLGFVLGTQPQAVIPSVPTESSPRRSAAREISVGLVVLAMAVATVYWLWRSPTPGPIPAHARPLVEAIAVLDEDFEAGRLKEGAYRKKRQSLKQQLHALLRGEEQKSG